jgi:hypothetical protein
LVTALSGHPFLVLETAVALWIVLGMLATTSEHLAVHSTWGHRAATIVFCAILLTAPLRGSAVRLPLEDYGFGPWQRDNSGRSFRETDILSSLFVDPGVTSVEIPMRLGGNDAEGSALVAVTVLGAFRNETRVTGEWVTQVVPLPGAEALEPRQRINLSVAPSGNGASRTPRLDIGQIRILSVR